MSIMAVVKSALRESFGTDDLRTMSERLRLTDIPVKRESPETLKPVNASKPEVVDANVEVEQNEKKPTRWLCGITGLSNYLPTI